MSAEKSIAVIGAGISGLAIARMLQDRGRVVVFEKDERPGGLVKCDMVGGVLYHKVGGHVFNSRRADVLEWFWKLFNREQDFHKATRRAVVSLPNEGCFVDYPIENHLYQMPETMRQAVIDDLLQMVAEGYGEPENFDAFLRSRFGKTLYESYFAPYNRKIWRRPLTDVPLGWLEGKLPMPTVKEILLANISQKKEMTMVHSTFWYALHGGSQFLADTLAEGTEIRYGCDIAAIVRQNGRWMVNGESFDAVVFTGNVRALPALLRGSVDLSADEAAVQALEFHGTTSVLCEIDANPYSWIYMPDELHGSHRIICTGNFSPDNAPKGVSTATIEFSEEMTREEIEKQLALIPLHPRYLAHHYEPCTYPVQTQRTKPTIQSLKSVLEPQNFYLLGRFAEWEYYNMDAAIGAALDLTPHILL